MPTYFPENNEARTTDSVERSMAKVVSQLPAALDKLSLDPHVAVYVARSGATDVANLDAFVKGVKALGLWDSMVCWPLRVSQNSGTNTAYSLGGLGTYNGTLVNSPTWGVDGLNFNKNASQRVDLPAPLRLTGHQEVMFKASSSAGGAEGPFDRGNGHHYARSTSTLYTVGIFNVSAFNINSSIAASSLLWHNLALTYGVGGMVGFSQGVQIGTNANELVGSSRPSNIKLGSGQLYWSGTIPFFADFSVRFNEAAHASFYTLYKSTLGTGLGLP